MKFILFFVVAATIPVSGICDLRRSHDKTQHIYRNFNLDSLCILQPITVVGWINTEERAKLLDSLSDAGVSSCEIDTLKEIHYSKVCKKMFAKFFRKISYLNKPSFHPQDSMIIAQELKKMEGELKNNLLDKYILSDRLCSVLSKYHCKQFLLTDFVEYLDNRYRNSLDFTQIRCFIVSLNSKEVEFYDYRIWYPPGGIWIGETNFRRVFKMLKRQM